MSILTFPEPAGPVARRERTLLAIAFLFITVAALGLLLAQSARLGSWDFSNLRWQHMLLLPVWLGCVLLAHWQANEHIPERDPLLLPLGYLLAGWGALTIWRLLPEFGLRQTGWLVAGTLLLVLIIRRQTDLAWLKEYRYLWLLAGLILTALTLLFGTHPSGGEPRLWLGWRGIYVQPSEFLRLLLIAFFASFLADRVAREWDQPALSFRGVLTPLFIVWGLSIGLLFVQRDLGTGTLFLGLLAVLLYLTTGRKEVLLLGGVFILLAGLAASLTFRVVQARLSAWLNPWADPIGYGYQLIQASMSMAAGGILGQGIGLGAPGIVPAAHTDFIFSAIVEEWGLLGGLALLAALAVLVQRGFRAAQSEARTFDMVLAAGLSAGMGLQALLIIGGVVRLLPLTGVTVPFASYGGSSLVTSFASLAILLKVSAGNRLDNRYRPRLREIQTGWLVGVAALALALGWWTIPNATELRTRTDNPRRNLAARYSARGSIYDRDEALLAVSQGRRGELNRVYPAQAVAPVVGFSSDRYGQSGIEAGLDLLLRGEQGYSPWFIWWHRLLQATPPPGHDVRLTLSLPLQQAAMSKLSGHVGAVVILDGTNGDVLALASQPSFEAANIDEVWDQLVRDPDSPLLNRTTQANYQPGTALGPFLFAWSRQAQLEFSVNQEDLAGPVPVAGELLSCAWSTSGSPIDSQQAALRHGCPKPWGSLAVALGPASLREMVTAFGFDSRLAIPLEQSTTWQGTLPADEERLLEFGYGQGDLTVSPIQMARAFSALTVGEGALPVIDLVDASRQPEGEWTAQRVELVSEQRAVSAQTALAARQALADSNLLEYSAQAIAGQAGKNLGWWMAADPNHPLRPVFVIVLEGESAMSARSLGLSLQQQASALLP